MVEVTRQETRVVLMVAAVDGGFTSETWRVNAKQAKSLAAILGPPAASTAIPADSVEGLRAALAAATGIVRTETP